MVEQSRQCKHVRSSFTELQYAPLPNDVRPAQANVRRRFAFCSVLQVTKTTKQLRASGVCCWWASASDLPLMSFSSSTSAIRSGEPYYARAASLATYGGSRGSVAFPAPWREVLWWCLLGSGAVLGLDITWGRPRRSAEAEWRLPSGVWWLIGDLAVCSEHRRDAGACFGRNLALPGRQREEGAGVGAWLWVGLAIPASF